eukprot:4775748-Alexandrium_andersonii.AAC.2
MFRIPPQAPPPATPMTPSPISGTLQKLPVVESGTTPSAPTPTKNTEAAQFTFGYDDELKVHRGNCSFVLLCETRSVHGHACRLGKWAVIVACRPRSMPTCRVDARVCADCLAWPANK